MDKLADIVLQNTVTVKIETQIDDQLVANNFRIIMDCLKDLKASQDTYESSLQKLTDRLASAESKTVERSAESIEDKNQGGQKASSGSNNQPNQHGDGDVMKLIKELEGRTSNNQKNVLENIKDINLVNKEITEMKEELQKLKKIGSSAHSETNNKGGLNLESESINNINKEVLRNREDNDKLREQMEKINGEVSSLKEKLDQFIKDSMFSEKDAKDDQSSNNNNNNGNSGSNGDGVSRAQFNELREKVTIVQKKTSGLQLVTDDLTKGQIDLEQTDAELKAQIEEIKEMIKRLKNQMENSNGSNGNGNGASHEDLSNLQRLIDQMRKELEAMKKQQNNSHSKTSIQDDSSTKGRFDKGSLTQGKFKEDDRLRELMQRVDYLEKMMGSKNSISNDDKNDKLPMIKRPRGRQASTHEKSSVKKDMNEIKNDLQAWLNNYLNNMKSKDNFEDLELKIQEIKNALGRKADQEGMKKGLMFLESKINQLYLFLTEPDGEDAMIVRKGFNCLSCSKKVEKLRGKLGPHINWNNMTATNYSPPKVGYSRHQNEGGEDDL